MPKLSRLKSILHLWSQRDLTPIGKITLIKTFALSQLVFLFQVLPNPPLNFIKNLESTLYKFIWGGKPDKVRRNTMINPIREGGLNVTHLNSFILGLKCTWVKRYGERSDAHWVKFFDYHLKMYGGIFLFNCNFKQSDVNTGNDFINDICHAWAVCNFKIPSCDFDQQILWNNSNIKVNNKIVLYKQWYDNGVTYVKDILDGDNNFLSFAQFQNQFNIRCSFLMFFGIIHAIPSAWKRGFNIDTQLPATDSLFLRIQRSPYPSRFIYSILRQQHSFPPKAITKWQNVFELSEEQWNNVFLIPYKSISESKILYFQFRFIHRILGTNYYLSKVNREENPRCTFCGENDETIDHLFWGCKYISNFILDTEQAVIGKQFCFTKQDFFFGYKLILSHPYNFLIFHVKYFIFQKRLLGEIPIVNEFIYKFKFALQVEQYLYKCKSRQKISFELLKNAFGNNKFLFE